MINYNVNNTALTEYDECETTSVACVGRRESCRNTRACCTGLIIGILTALLTAAIGILVGVTYAESIIPAFAAIIVFAVVVFVLILLALIYYYCTACRRYRCRCRCSANTCCD